MYLFFGCVNSAGEDTAGNKTALKRIKLKGHSTQQFFGKGKLPTQLKTFTWKLSDTKHNKKNILHDSTSLCSSGVFKLTTETSKVLLLSKGRKRLL